MTLLSFPACWVRLLVHFWPPFWFTGIRFTYISPDFRHLRVRMSLRFYNKNVVGIQYGGNLFSMTDPCYMLMLMRNLGDEYRVIDQSASIEFVKPGKGPVNLECKLTHQDIEDIVEATSSGDKYLKSFQINIIDNNDEVVAYVERIVYIRKRI